MAYSDTQHIGHGGRAPFRARAQEPIEVLVGRLRLGLGIAAVLALVVMATLGDGQSTPGPDSNVDAPVEQAETVFDGRGKWGGYAR